MRFPILTAAFAAICLSLPATAQKVQVFGGNGMRANSSLILFGANMMAGITITHGQPDWRDEYTGMLDKLKGRTNRLGKDLWTTFMNSVPLSIGGKTLPAGSYVVGLHCDKQGNFSLAMLEASKAMKMGAMPFGPQNWKADVMLPLTLNKNVAKEKVGKMKMTLAASKSDPMQGMFTLAWGPHTLTGKLKVLPKAKAGGKGDHGGDHDHDGGKHGEHGKNGEHGGHK